MPKPRTKRGGAGREERKRKREEATDSSHDAKKARPSDDLGDEIIIDENQPEDQEPQDNGNNDGYDDAADGANGYDMGYSHEQPAEDAMGEKEFFGMLNDDEQEYFRRADELLELNDFPATEDRDMFLENVFKEAEGKELKLASSQSCSRLMERLIQLSNTSQKKKLFEAFASHFLSLVQHRFASHCCEALFLRSAGVVTQELAGFVLDTDGGSDGENSMEALFLATLDELEGSMSFLITDRFASHTMRVLLVVLSGRPLEDLSVKTLMKSKKKENISVAGSLAADEQNRGIRAVPESFQIAVSKIITDCTSTMDPTALRVLAKHPIGNPTLQLFLELDLTLNKAEKKKDKKEASEKSEQPSLLQQLLPGAPKSLADETSEAAEFINGMIYDQIGSRLVETLIVHSPGKIFKALNQNIFLPRIQGYVRNDISCYPAIKVLNRIGKDDLVRAVEQIAPTVPQLVTKQRFNVIRTLFDRCHTRELTEEIKKLMQGLREGCGSRPVDLALTLCCLRDEEKKKKDITQISKNQVAIQNHGAQLLTTLLAMSGPAKGVQNSLSALDVEQILRLANTSFPTVTLLTTALTTPSANGLFQKQLVNTILPHVGDLAVSKNGHNLVNSIAEVPTKGKDYSIPAHTKDAIMNALAAKEAELRDCWMGRSVWRTWKGDMWKTRRHDWKAWMKDVGAELYQQQLEKQQQYKERRDGANAEPLGKRGIDKMDVDEPEPEPEQSVVEEVSEKKEKKEKKDKKEKREKKDKKEKKEKKDKKQKAEESEE